MRKTKDQQMFFGEINISQIEFDLKSRDDIPKLLRGLQYLYVNKDVREKIFEILENGILPNIDKKNGRPGMDLWKIFVMSVLRSNLNWDFDRLCEMVNNHLTVRQMLGHGFFDTKTYHLQTIKDNLALITPEILNEINEVIVDCGHKIIKKKTESKPAVIHLS